MKRVKFSIKQILAITTAVATLMGIAARLNLTGWDWWVVAAFSVYILSVGIVFLPEIDCSVRHWFVSINMLRDKRKRLQEDADRRRSNFREGSKRNS